MVIVVIPFISYYLFFVQSQTAYFTDRNFRVLAHIGSQIKSKIDDPRNNGRREEKKAPEKKSGTATTRKEPATPVTEADRLPSTLSRSF